MLVHATAALIVLAAGWGVDPRAARAEHRPPDPLGGVVARHARARRHRTVAGGVRGALSPHAHAPCARARSRAYDRAVPERRRSDSRRHGRARREPPDQVGQCARAADARPRPRPRHRRAADESRAPAGVRPLHRGGRLLAGRRPRFAPRSRHHARDADRPVRHRRETADRARHHRDRGGRPHAPRLHRQRVARAQDAAHGDQRLHRDAAGARARRAAARAVPAADAGAVGEHAAAGRGPADAVGARKRAQPGVGRAVRHRPVAAPCLVRREGPVEGSARDRARHRATPRP